MTTEDILAQVVFPAAFVSIAWLIWFGKGWVAGLIKHELDKRLEIYKQDQLRKEKAAVVAEFLAEWTHLNGADTKRLNQLLWELTLYLPSELVRELNLMVRGDYTKTQTLVTSIRDHLLDGKDPINASDVSHFKHPDNISMVSQK